MQKYLIADKQIPGRYFADGEVFEDKEEIRQQLIDYHSIDCDEESLNKMTLEQILEFGEWDLEKINN